MTERPWITAIVTAILWIAGLALFGDCMWMAQPQDARQPTAPVAGVSPTASVIAGTAAVTRTPPGGCRVRLPSRSTQARGRC